MWILEAINSIEFKKPFLVLLIALGAAWLLMARFFGLNPLYRPETHALLALNLVCLYQRPRSTLKSALAVLLCFGLAYLLVGRYLLLFAACFSLAAGKLVFTEQFRAWKWIASAALFAVSIWLVSIWQQLPFPVALAPAFAAPIVHGAIFSFCCLCSFSVYLLKKDSVAAAFESYAWESGAEAARMAQSTHDRYFEVRGYLDDEKQRKELEEFAEKMIHLSYQLLQISRELKQADSAALAAEITELENKVRSVPDAQASRQYQQALENKRARMEQFEALQVESERLRAQITNTLSALENIRFAYTHQQWNDTAKRFETLEFLLQMAKSHADNVYHANQAYGNLKN